MLIYDDSDYGIAKYKIDIHRSVWDSISEGINPLMVNEGGAWNWVYYYSESREELSLYIPGEWDEIVFDFE